MSDTVDSETNSLTQNRLKEIKKKTFDETVESSVDLWAVVDKTSLDEDVHIIPLEHLCQRFHSDLQNGLSTSHVSDALTQYGSNKMTPPKSPSYVYLLLKQLFMGFNTILWIACIFAFLAYKPFGEPNPSITNFALGVVLLLVITCNSILNVYQEIKSIKIVASFSKLLPTMATVRRDGKEQQILVDQIVPGDVILLRLGDKIPADCRFIISDGLKINTSALTGESKPIMATNRCTNLNFMESKNIGFYSSLVEQGTGEALVIATGDSTVLGKMSAMTNKRSNDEITGLHREVNRFVLFVFMATIVAIIILWVTWVVWLNRYHHGFVKFNENIVNSIGMIVGFLPLGLPSAVTLVLTIVARQMYRQRVLVKSLQIIETFNSVSVIATDKTGTLTQNKMKVTHVLWDTNETYKVSLSDDETGPEKNLFGTIRRMSLDALAKIRRLSLEVISKSQRNSVNIDTTGYRLSFLNDDIEHHDVLQVPPETKVSTFRDLILAAALCNSAEKQIIQDTATEQDKWKIIPETQLVGDAADRALYELCSDKFSMNVESIRKQNRRVRVLPFNSSNKFMISANHFDSNRQSILKSEEVILITLKGAPDIVIQRCASIKLNDGGIVPFDESTKKRILDRQEQFGKNGYRMIAMGQQRLNRLEYDQMIERNMKDQSSNTTENLNGLPPNDYCFIGLFSLLDPPRPEVPESVSKARRAHIRVAMVTGDHPTTAAAIARQVNIFSSEISLANGIDTFKVEKDHYGKTTFNLYRNDQPLDKHVLNDKTQKTKKSKKTEKKIEDNTNEEWKRIMPWYKAYLHSIRNQFSEPKVKDPSHHKTAHLPYAVVVTGSDINNMDDFMWDWVLSHEELVFARTSPEQKLRIVNEFQQRGEIVAVTGDGTNDAPALKSANLGVAMQSGTEVSKEAGDMILLDNNFASIIQAIETGRLLSENLKKVAIYLLPGGSWSQIWPVFFNLWFGMPLALSALWATVFCMLNDVFMSLAMVTEKPESDIMSRPPSIRRKDHLLNTKLLFHAYLLVGNFECFAAFFCYCYYWIDHSVPFYSFMFTYEKFGSDPKLPYTKDQLNSMNNVAQSIYYCSMCLFQVFNFFASRTRHASIIEHNPIYGKGRNLAVFGAILLSAGIQLLFTQITWFNQVLGTGKVPVKYVMPTLAFGLLWLVIDEIRKLIIRKYPNSFIARIAW